MKILGIDYGTKRIGIAISDPLGIVATGQPTLDAKTALEKIKHIVKLEPTIIEILDRLVEIAEKLRAPFLESKLKNKKFHAKTVLFALEEELKSVKAFFKKYEGTLVADETRADFESTEYDIQEKIDAEKAKLKEKGLL